MDIRNMPCWAKIGIAVGCVIFILNWPKSSSDWAAWVQAFGSIGAVFIAIFVMNLQHKRQVESKKLELKAEGVMLINAAEAIQTLLAGYHQSRVINRGNPEDDTDYEVLFRSWVEHLKRIEFTKGPVTEVAIDIVDLCISLDRLSALEKRFKGKSVEFRGIDQEISFAFSFIEKSRLAFIDFSIRHKLIDDNEYSHELKSPALELREYYRKIYKNYCEFDPK